MLSWQKRATRLEAAEKELTESRAQIDALKATVVQKDEQIARLETELAALKAASVTPPSGGT